jgi:hypothetical protein
MTGQSLFLVLTASCFGLYAFPQDRQPVRPAPVGQALAAGETIAPPAAPVPPAQQDAPAGGLVQVPPSWAASLAPGELCGTHHRYMAELAGQGTQTLLGLCPPAGPCDEPVFRDGFIFPAPNTQVLTVRLSIHVFCENNGGNCAATQADVDEAVARLNNDFALSGFQFTYETNFIDNTKFRYLILGSEDPQMKSRYADSPATKLNIYVVDTGGSSYGTFPWTQNALTAYGGIVVDDSWFGASSIYPTILTHEVGHCLGLWHTFHGVEEVPLCGDCYEAAGRSTAEGHVTGDLCSDTNPTPRNSGNCFDPAGVDPCSDAPWLATPFLNFMGYSHTCPDHFTAQQSGRMHCWTHEVLGGWLVLPPPLPGSASNPSPTDLAVGVSTDGDLSWSSGSGAISYDVWFGTSTPPDSLLGNPTSSSFDLGTLTADTTYFWRIDSVNTAGTTEGTEWRFTTGSGVPPGALFSDGFESGNFGAGGWTIGGSAAVNSGAAFNGSFGAELKRSASMQVAVATTGSSNIVVRYVRKTSGFDSGERLLVEWFNGTSWTQLESTASTSWATQSWPLPAGANDNPNFRLRFTTNANANNEKACVDDVEVTGG